MKRGKKLHRLPAFTAKTTKADQAWWMQDQILILLVVGLSMLDAVTLYTVFDRVMYQSQLISVILTLGVATALNFIPLVAARFTHLYRYRLNGIRLWMLLVLLTAFLALFTASFYLRWETRALSFSGMESTMVDSTGQAAGITSTDSDSQEAVAITVLLGILPGITSVINFFLGYLNDDPVRRRIDRLQIQVSQMEEHLYFLMAAREELDEDWNKRLNELDEARFQSASNVVTLTGEQIKAVARLELAKKLADPDSISALTEEA